MTWNFAKLLECMHSYHAIGTAFRLVTMSWKPTDSSKNRISCPPVYFQRKASFKQILGTIIQKHISGKERIMMHCACRALYATKSLFLSFGKAPLFLMGGLKWLYYVCSDNCESSEFQGICFFGDSVCWKVRHSMSKVQREVSRSCSESGNDYWNAPSAEGSALSWRKCNGWGYKASILGKTGAATRPEEQDTETIIRHGSGLRVRIGEGVLFPARIFFLSLCLVARSRRKVLSLIHTCCQNPDLALGPSYLNCSSSSK